MPDYRRRAAREAMSLRLDLNGMMDELIGAAGLTRADVDSLAARLSELTHALRGRRGAGELPGFDLPHDKDAVTRIKQLAAEVRDQCDTLVVVGVGDAIAGVRAVLEALPTDGPRVLLADTVDPWHLGRLLDELDLERTAFNVVSKSGETPETTAQFLVVRDLLLRALGAVDYAHHLVITTDAEHGPLRQVVHDEGLHHLPIPSGVPGRFTVFSAATLFPAAVAGVRIDDLLAGAAWMDQRCSVRDVWRNPAHLLATLLFIADTRRQRPTLVLMPFSTRLHATARWVAQLWATSLARRETIDGTAVRVPQTPLVAAGATDESAMLQLLLGGPADKVACLIRVDDHGRELQIPASYADVDGIGYLGGFGLGALLTCRQRAVEAALLHDNRPTAVLTLPQLNPFTLGQLLVLFQTTVVFLAGLYRVDPFAHPDAARATRLACAQLGRHGLESARAELDALFARKREHYML